jgi:uncharacterized heparinase superfamily protein
MKLRESLAEAVAGSVAGADGAGALAVVCCSQPARPPTIAAASTQAVKEIERSFLLMAPSWKFDRSESYARREDIPRRDAVPD